MTPWHQSMLNICQAIARQEGFGVPGSRPTRLHNPGDLEYKPWMEQFGGVLETGVAKPRFALFPDDASGFAAMKHLLQFPLYAGHTIHNVLNKWAPPVENDTSAYERNVVAWTGLSADTVIDDHLG